MVNPFIDETPDRNRESYAEYVKRYYRPTAKDGRPGYEGAGPNPVMSEAQFYYTQSGQHYKDLLKLEEEYGRHGFDRTNFEKMRDAWWERVRTHYGYPAEESVV